MAIDINREYLQGLSDEAFSLDAELTAGTPGAGKRAVINRIAAEDPTDISSLIEYFAGLSDTKARLGVFTKLMDAIEDKYDKEFDALVTPMITVGVQSSLSDEDREVKIARRKQIKAEWDAITAAWAFMFKPGSPEADISDIRVPNKLTALRGVRGPRAISSYQFYVDDVELSKSQNSLKWIASSYTKTDKDGSTVAWTARDLRDHGVSASKANGVELDWTNPPESFSFLLPDGVKVFKAVKIQEDSDDNE